MRALRSWVLVLLSLPVTACHRDIPSLEPRLAAAPPPRFPFRPPEDPVLTETVNTSWGREGAPLVQEAEMTTTSSFSSEQEGWRLTQRVTRVRVSGEATPAAALVEQVLQRAPLQVRLSEDGTFVRLLEPEAARAALQAVAPAGMVLEPLERFFAPEALEARARAEWEVKYGGVYGHSLVQGQHTYALGTLSLGGHEANYLLERTFSGWRLTEFGETLVFSLRCLEPPGDKAPAAVLETLHRAGDPQITPGVQCEGEQLLGEARFLPVRRGFTLRAKWDGDTWTWTTQSALESPRASQEEKR